MAPSSATHLRRGANVRTGAFPESRLRLGRQRFRSSAGKLVGKTTSDISDASTDFSTQQESSSSSSGKHRRRSPGRGSFNTRSCEQNDFLDGTENLDSSSTSYPCERNSPSSTLFTARRPSDAASVATAPLDTLAASWSSRLTEATLFPDEQRNQVDRTFSDTKEAHEDQARDEEFSFSTRYARKESTYSENTCTKLDHALEYTEELLAKCRALSCCDTPVSLCEHKESMTFGIEESPVQCVKDGSNNARSEEQVISSFIKHIEELTFDPEVLSLITHSGEIMQIVKELSVPGNTLEATRLLTRLYELLQACTPVAIGEKQPSGNVSVFGHTVSSSSGHPRVNNIVSDSRLKSSASSVVASANAYPLPLAAPPHAQKIVQRQRSCDESASSAYVVKSGLESLGKGSSPLPSKASRGRSVVLRGRNSFTSRSQASSWNTRPSCECPQISRDASGSAPIRSPRRYSPHRVQVEVQPPSVPPLSPSQRQASPTRVVLFRGCEGTMNSQVASPESESNAMLSHNCHQSTASRILQTAFGAVGTPGQPRRSITASPVRLHSTISSSAKERVMSPSLQMRAPSNIAMQPPVAAPLVVSPQLAQVPSRDAPCHPVALPSSLQLDRTPTQYIWEPISIVTSYRLRAVN